MPGLADKYRHATWEAVAGQDKVISHLRTLAWRGGLAGRAHLLSGQSGPGKTTIARFIAAEVAGSFLIEVLYAAALTVSDLPAIETEMQMPGWGEHWHQSEDLYWIEDGEAAKAKDDSHPLVSNIGPALGDSSPSIRPLTSFDPFVH